MTGWTISVGRPATAGKHDLAGNKRLAELRKGEIVSCGCGGAWELLSGKPCHYFLTATNGKCKGLMPDCLFDEWGKGEKITTPCSCGYLLEITKENGVEDHFHKLAIRFESYMGAWYPEHAPPEVNESWERYQRTKGADVALINNPRYQEATVAFDQRMAEAGAEIEKRRAKFQKRAAEDPLFSPGRTEC